MGDDIATCIREAHATLIRADDGIRVGADAPAVRETRREVLHAIDVLTRVGELMLGEEQWEKYDRQLDEED
jgi:hypothetical protein